MAEVFPKDQLLTQSLAVARRMSGFSRDNLLIAKNVRMSSMGFVLSMD